MNKQGIGQRNPSYQGMSLFMLLLISIPVGWGKTTAPTQPRIVFAAYTGVNFQIFSMPLDGKDAINLTNQRVDGRDPVWSPDGGQIFFSSVDGNREIYVMDADGSNLGNLTRHPGRDVGPAVSPDGKWLAFRSERETGAGIYLMTTDGNAVRQLTNFGYDPDWSPDGQWIAFQQIPDLFVVNVGRRQIQNLTQGRYGLVLSPAWSPDGRSIVFTAWIGKVGQIVRLDLPDRFVRLTHTATSEMSPAWSPDGQKIAFVSQRVGRGEIFVMDADGRRVRQITADGMLKADLDWFDPAFAPPQVVFPLGKWLTQWGWLKGGRWPSIGCMGWGR